MFVRMYNTYGRMYVYTYVCISYVVYQGWPSRMKSRSSFVFSIVGSSITKVKVEIRELLLLPHNYELKTFLFRFRSFPFLRLLIFFLFLFVRSFRSLLISFRLIMCNSYRIIFIKNFLSTPFSFFIFLTRIRLIVRRGSITLAYDKFEKIKKEKRKNRRDRRFLRFSWLKHFYRNHVT